MVSIVLYNAQPKNLHKKQHSLVWVTYCNENGTGEEKRQVGKMLS